MPRRTSRLGGRRRPSPPLPHPRPPTVSAGRGARAAPDWPEEVAIFRNRRHLWGAAKGEARGLPSRQMVLRYNSAASLPLAYHREQRGLIRSWCVSRVQLLHSRPSLQNLSPCSPLQRTVYFLKSFFLCVWYALAGVQLDDLTGSHFHVVTSISISTWMGVFSECSCSTLVVAAVSVTFQLLLDTREM